MLYYLESDDPVRKLRGVAFEDVQESVEHQVEKRMKYDGAIERAKDMYHAMKVTELMEEEYYLMLENDKKERELAELEQKLSDQKGLCQSCREVIYADLLFLCYVRHYEM